MIYAYDRPSQCDIVLSRERVLELSGLSSCLERILKIVYVLIGLRSLAYVDWAFRGSLA